MQKNGSNCLLHHLHLQKKLLRNTFKKKTNFTYFKSSNQSKKTMKLWDSRLLKFLNKIRKKSKKKNSKNSMDLLYCFKKFGTAEKLLWDTISSSTFCSCTKPLLLHCLLIINFSKKPSLKSKMKKTGWKIFNIKFHLKELSMIQNSFQKISI